MRCTEHAPRARDAERRPLTFSRDLGETGPITTLSQVGLYSSGMIGSTLRAGALLGVFTAAACLTIAGCATPRAVPTNLRLPSIVASALPVAHSALLAWSKAHDDRVPDTSAGEQIVLQSLVVREATTQELNAAGEMVSMSEFIDSAAYAFRPAQEQFLLAVAGHVIRKPAGGGRSMIGWYCYKGRYTRDGEIIEDQTVYLENAELFIDAMRGTSHNVPWNSSAWAVTHIFNALVAQQGEASAEAMVQRFVRDAVESGRARVPSGMPPRQAAFGGVAPKTPTAPSATPPADQ